MTEMSRDALMAVVRQVWTERDPVPVGLVAKMQAVLAAEDFDLDYELLVLIERSHELAGARGGSAYTLQFAHGDVALLVRAAAEEQPGDGGRLDGWLAPVTEMSVKAALVSEDGEWETDVDSRGRFEFRNLPSGLFRLWLTPRDAGAKPFGTPAFEL
jgi:hypothetical protein